MENAAKKDIKDADVKEFYDANRAQFPGKFDDEKAKDAATTRLVRGESHLVLPTIPAASE